MKHFVQLVLVVASFLVTTTTHAATFTAVQSGDWSSAATWGGSAPSFNVLADDIHIPAGINVNLDGDLTLNGLLVELNILGTLSTNSNAHITLEQGLLAGTGVCDVQRFAFKSGSNSTFTGDMMVDVLATESYNLFLNGYAYVSDSLIMKSGNVQTSDSLIVAANSVVWARGGSVTGSGDFAAEGDFDIYYTGSTMSSGKELTATTVNHVTVELDNATSELTVDSDAYVHGTLELVTGVCNLDGHTLKLMGDYSQSSNAYLASTSDSRIIIASANELSSSLMFNENNDVGVFHVNYQSSGDASIDSDAHITDSLILSNGNLSIESGNAFTVADQSAVVIAQGSIDVNGSASYENEGRVHLRYEGGAKSTGAEAESGTVSTLKINMDGSEESLTLQHSMMVEDSTHIESGNILCNGNDLGFDGYTSTSVSNDLTIDGDSNAALYLRGAFAANTVIKMQSEDSLSALVVDMDAEERVYLEGNTNVRDSISLHSGILIASDNRLSLSETGAFYGGSSDSYIITEGNSMLSLWVEGDNQSEVWYHVGDEDGYCPVSIQNAETNDAYFNLHAESAVFANGSGGYDLSNSEQVVNKTWDITADANADVDMTLTAQWASTMEVNGFDRTEAYISHYVNGAWDVSAAAEAQSTTTGSYELTRSGITSLSPFSVQNEGAATGTSSVDEVALSLYPNPVVNQLTVSYGDADIDRIELVDLSGKVIRQIPTNTDSQQQRIDASDLVSGVYFLNLYDDGAHYTTKRVIKR